MMRLPGPAHCASLVIAAWAAAGACSHRAAGKDLAHAIARTKFVAGDPYGDCNADGQLTVADFGCFQTRFVAACP